VVGILRLDRAVRPEGGGRKAAGGSGSDVAHVLPGERIQSGGRSLRSELLQANGVKLSGGTIVDATLIDAPSSTKNQKKERDPEMHSTQKRNQWCFGMKLHIGTDSRTGLAPHTSVTAANIHDRHEVPNLLFEDETRFYGDSVYRGKAQH
jgi:IS5 family transposase